MIGVERAVREIARPRAAALVRGVSIWVKRALTISRNQQRRGAFVMVWYFQNSDGGECAAALGQGPSWTRSRPMMGNNSCERRRCAVPGRIYSVGRGASTASESRFALELCDLLNATSLPPFRQELYGCR